MFVKPMLCQAIKEDPGSGWIRELKLDGERAIIEVDSRKQISIWSRSGKSNTFRYPEIVQALSSHAILPMILDGEIIGDNFSMLAQRARLSDSAKIRQSVLSNKVTFVAFDLLELNGT